LKRILAAASNVVKKKTKKQAEVRWSNDATWTLFIQCVKAVKPAGADGWNTVAHEFRTACETWNKRQPSPYSRHIITCGALSCVGSQLRSKWNTYLKRQKPTGVGPCRDQKTERTRQVHELQQTIEEEIAAGDIGVRQEKPTFDKQPKSRQAAEAEVASSAEKRKREHDAMTLIEKETFSSDDLDHAGRVLIAEAGKSAAKLKKSQACQLSDRMDASENARREFVLMQMNHSKEMMAEFARQQHIMIQTLLTGRGAVPAQPPAVEPVELAASTPLRRRIRIAPDLPRPEESLWSRVKANRKDQAYVHLTGLPVAEFEHLARAFHPEYMAEVQRRKPKGSSNFGRKRNSSSSDVLALTLAYLRDGGPDMHRQAHFGLPRSCLSRLQELGLVTLFNTLSSIPEALVTREKMDEYVELAPTREKMDEYVELISGMTRQTLTQAISTHRSCVSVRQASEWGVGSLQKDYKILTRLLTNDQAPKTKQKQIGNSRRKLILDCCILLHNFRVSCPDIPN